MDTIDWNIHHLTDMEFDRPYRRAGQSYCSSCGIGSLIRDDLVLIRRHGAHDGQGWSFCPDHLRLWESRDERAWRSLTGSTSTARPDVICDVCFQARSVTGRCGCDE